MGEERSDQELAERLVRDGDEHAFRTPSRRHTPAVYQFVLSLAGGKTGEAEDIV